MITRGAAIGVVLGVLATLLAGCGIRGTLDNPNGRTKSSSGTLTAPSKIGEPAEKAPHRDFLLDGLIR
jgi:hypothetical protein